MNQNSDRVTIDEQKHRAYVLSVEADALIAAGRFDEARRLMQQAAVIDGAYSIRAEHVGQFDKRTVRVSTAVRSLLIPWLSSKGFNVDDGDPWSEGKFLRRVARSSSQSLVIGRVKFGHALSVLAARIVLNDPADYYDFRKLNLRSGSLAYKTQTELEAVCVRWREILEQHVLPWLESDP